MLLELHVIQNVAPANLNRDDTGAPKDAIFGGYRRARVSSQAWKRAVRNAFAADDLVPENERAIRTKRVVERIATALAEKGRDKATAEKVAVALLGGIGLTAARDPGDADDPAYYTQYLIYAAPDEIARLAELADANWDALAAATASAETGKKAKKDNKASISPALKDEVLKALDGGRAADLALFGRMLADLPTKNIDASTQVAHAISTHPVEFEFDYYTAVDDLNPEEETGAGMIGTVEFNSATFYRYTNVDLGQLTKNLGGDEELARKAALAYAKAFVLSMPTGKQNSFAAQTPPSCALAVVRTHGRWSLANAFVNPVDPREDGGLVTQSVLAMGDQFVDLSEMYGDDDIVATSMLYKVPATADHGRLKDRVDKLTSGYNPVGSMREWLGAVDQALDSAGPKPHDPDRAPAMAGEAS